MVEIKKRRTLYVLIILSIIFVSCADNKDLNNTFESRSSKSFLDLANQKRVKLELTSNKYENVEYVKFVDLDKYYKNGKLVDKAFVYQGNIEYYDKEDNLIKEEINTHKVLLTDGKNFLNAGITNDGYLTNEFGMLILDEGFYKLGNDYYYVSGETHKVVDCSNATVSNAIKKSDKIVVEKNNEKYIVYSNDEKNGEKVKNQIININGEIYLTNEEGKIVDKCGIYDISNIYDDTLHLLYEGLDGKLKTSKTESFSCYVNESGKVVVGDKIVIGNKIYFSNFDGRLLKDEYLWRDIYFDNNMTLSVSSASDVIDDNAYIQYILNSINNKKVNKTKKPEYKFYIMERGKNEIATSSEASVSTTSETKYDDKEPFVIEDEFIESMAIMIMDVFRSDRNVYVKDRNNEMVKNKIIKSDDRMCYVGENGVIVKNKIINVDNNNILIDKNGSIVRNCFIFDKKYYDNEKLASREAPYINDYKVDREMIKPYLGCYILSSGEILKDNIFIESAILDENGNAIKIYKVKNGEYDGAYNKDIFKLNTYKEGEEEYNYEEYEEGYFSYIHRYKSKNRKDKIDDNNIDEQIKYRYEVKDIKGFNRDTVLFGAYPNHDTTGEVKEPIEWIILMKNEREALLMTKRVIDAKEFDENGKIEWENSTLNSWLNSIFINEAFTNEEQEKIIQRNGMKKIFLLSKNEYDMYEEEVGKLGLLASYTNYSTRDIDDSVDKFLMNNWLRSNTESGEAGKVDTEWIGSGFSKDPKIVCGVRPAIYIKLNEE